MKKRWKCNIKRLINNIKKKLISGKNDDENFQQLLPRLARCHIILISSVHVACAVFRNFKCATNINCRHRCVKLKRFKKSVAIAPRDGHQLKLVFS